jgi:hypothetical protein
MRFLFVLSLAILAFRADSFFSPKRFASLKSLIVRKVVVDRPSTASNADSWPKFPKPFGDTDRVTPIRDIITEPVMDTNAISKDFAYQGVVLNLSFLLSMIFDVDMMHYTSSTSFFHLPSLIQSGLVLFVLLGMSIA